MLPIVLQAGLAAGYLTYLLTQSSASPNRWRRFQKWWADRGWWEGKPFLCMICMSFWFSLLLLLPTYGMDVYWSIFIPCTAPQCIADGAARYWFEVINSIEGLALGTFAASCISMIVCYLTDKLFITILK